MRKKLLSGFILVISIFIVIALMFVWRYLSHHTTNNTLNRLKANLQNTASPKIKLTILNSSGVPVSWVEVSRKVEFRYDGIKIVNFGYDPIFTNESGSAEFSKITISELVDGPHRADFKYLSTLFSEDSLYRNSARTFLTVRLPAEQSADFSPPRFTEHKGSDYGVPFTDSQTGLRYFLNGGEILIPLANRVENFECTLQLKRRI